MKFFGRIQAVVFVMFALGELFRCLDGGRFVDLTVRHLLPKTFRACANTCPFVEIIIFRTCPKIIVAPPTMSSSAVTM